MGSAFTEFELDVLQEIMNMAFGSAAADLADVVDVFVQLNAPKTEIIPVGDLAAFVSRQVGTQRRVSVVEQEFHGGSDGLALLVFTGDAERQLISLFQDDPLFPTDAGEMLELEREVLMEVGNILIGACVGRLFELLQRPISYLPPHATGEDAISGLVDRRMFSSEDFAISMQARFSFEDREVSGFLFLINRQESEQELRSALQDFWSEYQ